MGKIVRTLEDLKSERLVATSGGFDPIHVGHLRCIQESAELARKNQCKLAVIVNGDGWLSRKKGRPFMNCEERMEIIAGLAGVDYVVEWDDGGPTVSGAIRALSPIFFTKGGDRTEGGDVGGDYRSSKVPEFEICAEIGCEVVFGVGGGKVQASSSLLKENLSKKWEGSLKEKPWGFEVWWSPTDAPYAGKVIHIESGHRLSLQYHERKEETVLVLSGSLKVQGGSEEIILGPGQTFHVKPGQVHRFGATNGGSCTLVEVSTNDLQDVIRLEDDYKRG